MKKGIAIFLFVMTLLVGQGTVAVFAYEKHNDQDTGTTDPQAGSGTTEAIPVGNKTCPVSGQDVHSMNGAATISHNGKAYNLCCKMCAADFNKDPEKYGKIAEENVKSQ